MTDTTKLLINEAITTGANAMRSGEWFASTLTQRALASTYLHRLILPLKLSSVDIRDVKTKLALAVVENRLLTGTLGHMRYTEACKAIDAFADSLPA